MKKTLYILFFIVIGFFTFSCQSNNDSPTDPNNNDAHQLNKRGGHALEFDGSYDFVEIRHHPSLNMTNRFTITAWIYLTDYTEWASIVTKGGYFGAPDDATLDNNYTIHQTGPDGRLRFTSDALFPDVLPESETVIPKNEWHHIAVTFDGTTIRFYLDGVPDGQGDIVGPLTPNENALRIGVDVPGGDEYWNGRIDEVKIWRETLTRKQIRRSMRGSATPRARALVGYWRFNEGRGTLARDRSRFRNHGIISGANFVSHGAH